MNTTIVAMGIAGLATGGIVVTLGLASLLSGGVHFFLSRPRLKILKSEHGERGLAFGLTGNIWGEEASFDQVKVRLFAPFASPKQIEISHLLQGVQRPWVDIEIGPKMTSMLKSPEVGKGTLQIEVGQASKGLFHQFEMKAQKLLSLREEAQESPQQFMDRDKGSEAKPLYPTVQRSFVADPLEKSPKVLKLATNPLIQGLAAEAAPSSSPAGAEENFQVSKVWIDPGCIVCNACEAIYPEVFEVTDTTCLIRPEAPLHDGLKILEAAEACPVEVIKFTKAS